MGNLFDPDGMLMRAMSDLASLVLLNLLTLLCCLPIVTAGASLAAMHYVLYQMADKGEGRIASTFLREFKANLKNMLPITLLLYVFIGIGALEYGMFRNQAGASRVAVMFVYAGALVLLLLSVWIFPLSAKFVYPFGAVFKNAAILAVTHIPRTLLMALIMVVLPFILTQDMRLLPLAFLLGISFPSYLCTLLYHPIFQKMIDKRAVH